LVDPTIHSFSIDANDPGHYFSDVVALGFGGDPELDLNADRVLFIRSICRELQNSELFEMTFAAGEAVDRKGLISRGEFCAEVGQLSDSEVEEYASHFYEFSPADFSQSSFTLLLKILSHPKLVLSSEDSLFQLISDQIARDSSSFPLLEFVRFEYLSSECMKSAFEVISRSFECLSLGIWAALYNRMVLSAASPAYPNRFVYPSPSSKIVSSCPEIFARFQGSDFRLLYRGTENGFRATDFHRCCNGHPNTMTLILTTENYIFGGYTPVVWNSRNAWVPDPSMKTFLFTIRNPHNLSPRIFTMAQPENAIADHGSYGPSFGYGYVIYVCDECNFSKSVSADCYTNLANNFVNDTGIPGKAVFTGSYNFTVKEIEVFEVKLN
jgi:hypothetical protein